MGFSFALLGLLGLVGLAVSMVGFFTVLPAILKTLRGSAPMPPPEGASPATARQAVRELSPGQEAYRCASCGATVDSTAELSADGRVKCNYCGHQTSLFESSPGEQEA